MANKNFKTDITADGDVSGKYLKATNSNGDEGGEILLSKPQTNTTIAGTGVTFDVWQNRIRFFEQGGDARGYYIDITGGGAGASTNLVGTGGGGTASNSFATISVSGQDNVAADSSTDILTLIAGTNVSISTNATNDSITINSAGNYTSVDSITYPDYITFDTTPETVPTATGSIFWDSGDGLPATVLNANVTIGLGQEQVALVKNDTGASIAKGKVVYINGAQGQRPTITLSDADTETTSSKTFGLTAEAIADEAEGFVTTFGVLRGVNTLGLTEGAALWLSSTAGGYTTTVPPEPAHSVFLGYVVKAHETAGEVFVNIQNGYELTELHGVVIEADESLADNEVLAYDLASGLWKNQTGTEAGLAELSGAVFTGNIELDATKKLIFDGTTNEAYKTTLYVVDPTSDREVLLPDAAGTIALTSDLSPYLTSSTAASTYAPIASPTFTGTVTIPAGASIDGYLTTSSASSTYLTQSNAASTYLTQTSAASTYQPLDTELTALAGTTSAADALPYFTGSGTASVTTLSSFGRSLIDDADSSAARTTLGVVIGTNVQEYSSTLLGISTLGSGTGFLKNTAGTWSYDNNTYSLSSHNHDATYQPLDADLTALAGLTSAANALPYFTGSGTATTTTLSSFGRSLIDDADAPAARTTLGLGTMAIASTSDYAALSGATFTGDIAVNGGDITTTSTTAKLYHSNATTIEIGHAATALSIGDIGHTGTTTVNNNLEVYGSITFSQGASSLSATTINIDDTLISLADNNTADILDIGFFAGYRQSSTDYHTGLVRDASDSGIWKLFAGVTTQPTGTVDFTSATYGTLKIGALQVTDASTTRTNLGLAIGTNVQAYNATLAAVAGGTYTGDDSIATVGTITSGTWNGSVITDAYINNALTISGGTVDNTPIGATTASTGKFTSVNIDGEVLIDTFVGTGTGSASETAANETSWGSTYSCAEYIVSVSNGTTGRYTSKVMLMSNGSTSSITEYAIQTVGTITSPTITAGATASALKLSINAVNGYAITLVRTLVTA